MTAHLSRRALLGTAATLSTFAQPPHLQYNGRKGGYSEGIQIRPASGEAGLVLMAALVEHNDPDASLPRAYRAQFYMPAPADVFLTISEVEPLYFYRLEADEPLRRSWKPGRVQFEWSTQEVIKDLHYKPFSKPRQLRLDSLGAVARLNAPSAGKADKLDEILPVALYHARPPAKAEKYRFVFRPEFKSDLAYRLFGPDSTSALQTQRFEIALADKPNEFLADLRGRACGWYRVVAAGHAIRDNAKVYKQVRFYHRSEPCQP